MPRITKIDFPLSGDYIEVNQLLKLAGACDSGGAGKLLVAEGLVSVDGQSSKAMADQIMATDKARLKSQLGVLGKADLLAVEDAIRVHLGLAK